MQKINSDILIIGAGVSGIFTAYLCQNKGQSVTLLDHGEKPGLKWSLAGGAMGNMTNRTVNADHYVSHTPKQAKKLLQSLFKNWKTEQVLKLLQDFGTEYEEREFGQIFCKKPVRIFIEKLVRKLEQVRIVTNEKIQTFFYDKRTDGNGQEEIVYTVKTKNFEIECRKLVIATGSNAYPQTGATDFALRLAKKWGHSVFDFRPVLVPLLFPDRFPLLGLEGISIPVRAKVLHDGQEKKDPCGIRSLLFTHGGISGPAVLVASCFWEKDDTVSLNFLPENNVLELMHDPNNGKKLLKNLLLPLLPDRLAYALMPAELQLKKVAELSKKERQKIYGNFHDFRFVPKGTDTFAKAEACTGGVAVSELTANLESTKLSNLFFAGECIDITGLLGGYNIHFALACAKKISERL